MTADRIVLTVVIFALTAVIPRPALALADAEKDQPSMTRAFPEVPVVRLAPMPGFDDDDAYMRSIADRAAQLADQAEHTVNPMARTDLLLSSANLILAYELEPACTRRLLHIAGGSNAPDESAVAAALDRADRLITQAGVTIQEATDRSESLDDHWRERRHRQQALTALAKALGNYLIPGHEPEAARSARLAASHLSVLLEDDNPRVVAAAGLWQACLRSRESDLEPALSRLAPALADPPPHSLPYAFFGRMLRCRLLADQGGFAAALALLTQMEDLCDEWMSGDTDRADALRAVTLVEMQILSVWHDRLSAITHAAERTWCVKRIDTLRAERFGEGNNTVLRLTPAIPILTSHPGPNGKMTDPSPDET